MQGLRRERQPVKWRSDRTRRTGLSHRFQVRPDTLAHGSATWKPSTRRRLKAGSRSVVAMPTPRTGSCPTSVNSCVPAPAVPGDDSLTRRFWTLSDSRRLSTVSPPVNVRRVIREHLTTWERAAETTVLLFPRILCSRSHLRPGTFSGIALHQRSQTAFWHGSNPVGHVRRCDRCLRFVVSPVVNVEARRRRPFATLEWT